jgi:hypothetical protein
LIVAVAQTNINLQPITMLRTAAWMLVPLALALQPAFADDDRISALSSPSMATPEPMSSSDESILEVPAPPVVIEGELPHIEPTPQELMQHFRQSLAAPPSFLSSERRLADGTIEASNRLGRFCAPPVPMQSVSGVGGDVRLIVPCASF